MNTTTATAICIGYMLLIAGWVWDHDVQTERYAMAMSNWCPHWQTTPAMCEAGRMPRQ